MNEVALAQQSAQLVCKHLMLDSAEADALTGPEPSREQLLQQLTRLLSYLLDQDMERLLQGMYRIDVPEAQFVRLLNTAPPESLAADLAQLILAREEQKVITRERYKNNG